MRKDGWEGRAGSDVGKDGSKGSRQRRTREEETAFETLDQRHPGGKTCEGQCGRRARARSRSGGTESAFAVGAMRKRLTMYLRVGCPVASSVAHEYVPL